MHEGISRSIRMPKGIPVVRHRPAPSVELPPGVSELPLIDKTDKKERYIQEHWVAKIRVLDMSDPNDIEECEKIWQGVCDGLYKMAEHRTEFVKERGTFVQLLRYAELHHKLPEEQG